MKNDNIETPTTKAEALRMANMQSPNMSNAQLKNFLRKKWGMHVEGNQISEVLGSEATRRNQKAESLKIKLAFAFLKNMGGDHKEAVRILRLAAMGGVV